ncbi:hypothetical protein BJ508DRAFT_336314 [Ascobolus immersus RN42]|uniref:Uncharacterized protein n=1 Tax=Ascobolus immersus RN42 TaxID=1160509 RepID=A0A3N4HD35_ASCIM|nr:hypothetical protein BJ508DRAFT_336314 [Ascobolus immersus RN42]
MSTRSTPPHYFSITPRPYPHLPTFTPGPAPTYISCTCCRLFFSSGTSICNTLLPSCSLLCPETRCAACIEKCSTNPCGGRSCVRKTEAADELAADSEQQPKFVRRGLERKECFK